MTDSQIFNALFNGGNIALPYLVEISNGTSVIRLVNNNNPVTYGANTYGVSTFDYTPPDQDGNGGSLSLSVIDNEVYELIENTPTGADFKLKVVGLLLEGNNIQPLRNYKHFKGSVSISDNLTAEFTLQKDDRLEMQFPPYKFDTDNNRSNA